LAVNNVNMKQMNVNSSQDTTFEQRSQEKVQAGEINESIEFRNQITTFVHDNPIITEQLIGDSPQPSGDVRSVSDARTHSIIDFLERPQFIGSFLWNTSDIENKEIFSLKLPDALMSPMIREKLSGFTSFSASTVFHIQVNAHPFQCGRLVLAAVPVPDILPLHRLNMLSFDVSNVITLPHVQLDISKETEVLLKIPYVSPFVQYDLVTKFTPWAAFLAHVYAPLNTPSAASLQVNVFAHFEDIKLGFPTSAIVAQAGKEQLGPISGLTNTVTGVVGGVADAVKGFFPSIGKYADPLVGIGNGLTGLLSALGFSKPLTTIPPTIVVQRPSQYFNNADGVDQGLPLSLKYGNEVILKTPFAGTSSDEVALEYVLKIPNYFSRFKYSSTSLPKQVLWTSPVHPQIIRNHVTVVDAPGQPTLLAYATGFFKYWRGGLVYTFRFVKTNYHSGRVQITFHPFVGYDDVMDSDGKIVRDEYVYRVVVDLRDQTEATLVVPFTSLTPYKVCADVFNSANRPKYNYEPRDFKVYDNTTDQFFTGTLCVSALTPLVSSSAVVSSTIDVLVEVKASDDFEVAVPNTPLWLPVDSLTERPSLDGVPIAQVGFASAGTRDIRSSYVEGKFIPQDITGMSRNHELDEQPSQECIGERILSFSELIKRNSWRYVSDEKSLIYPAYAFDNPAAMYTAADKLPVWTLTPRSGFPTLLTSIGAMYAFYRGGIRLKIVPGVADQPKPLVEVALFTMQDQGYIIKANDYSTDFCSSNIYENFVTKGIAEVQTPYYSRVNTSVVSAPVLYNAGNISPLMPNVMYKITSNSSNILLGHSAADDFRFGFLLGAPLAISATALRDNFTGSSATVSLPTFSNFYLSSTSESTT
ncbi:capsid protein precursor, partial [Triatoma virus]